MYGVRPSKSQRLRPSGALRVGFTKPTPQHQRTSAFDAKPTDRVAARCLDAESNIMDPELIVF
jgi:hypothetical protein